ncbi:hypothetical protein LSAT2_007746 [Lamellibrachia satsuma]|nr:hypothetical protein LSAT2_007746 [Lamellibrachia satsuma]
MGKPIHCQASTKLFSRRKILGAYQQCLSRHMPGNIISKAFDTVPHARLINKLHYYGVSSEVTEWIENWQKEKVVVDGVEFSDDLTWIFHISHLSAKANQVLGFTKRNLYNCSEKTKQSAYFTLTVPKIF